MSTEYLKLMHSERVYGGKNLLESQLNMINMKTILENYKRTRNEELNLKIKLKKKIQELKDALSVLEKSLPKSKMEKDLEKEEEAPKEVKIPKNIPKATKTKAPVKDEGHSELESEIAEIRRKLAAFQ